MRRLALWTLFLVVVVSCGAAMAGGSTAPARPYWQAGVEAMLPADAVTGPDQIVSLGSISCPSAGSCSAVGSYLTTAGRLEGLLLSETDGRWAPGIQAVLPADAVASGGVSVDSVSCSSAGNCSAVGSYYDSAGQEGLLLRETAGKWGNGTEAALPATAVTQRQSVFLNSVSCPSNGNCTAVGGYQDGSGLEALTVTESDGAWQTGVEVALPADANSTQPTAGLTEVSCASVGNCSAVGEYGNSSGNEPGLLVTETAGTWGKGVEATLPANAAVTEQFVGLFSISCSSAGSCTAVGTYNTAVSDDAVLLSEKAGAWSPGVKAALPANADPTDQIDLNSVSCPSDGNCVAVGDYVDRGGNIRGVLLSRTAGTWSEGVEAKLPANALTTPENQLGGLASVSCASAGNCTAVGSYRAKGDKPYGLFVTETAGRWATGVQGIVRQNAAYGASLRSVSCSSAQRCSAVGGYEQAQGVLFSSSATPPCLVPRLKGKTLTAARRSIKAGHCAVGKVRRAASRKVESGRVISQTPKPGLLLKHGARLALVVSSGR
jgi:hypothetical protein